MYTTVDKVDMNKKTKIVSIELGTEANNVYRLWMISYTITAVREITIRYNAFCTIKILSNKYCVMRI